MEGMRLRAESTQLKGHACMGPYSAQRCAYTHCPASQCCLQDCRWQMDAEQHRDTAPLQR